MNEVRFKGFPEFRVQSPDPGRERYGTLLAMICPSVHQVISWREFILARIFSIM